MDSTFSIFIYANPNRSIILVMSEQPSLNQKTGTGYSNFRYFNKTYSQNFLNMKLALQVLLCTIFSSKKKNI